MSMIRDIREMWIKASTRKKDPLTLTQLALDTGYDKAYLSRMLNAKKTSGSRKNQLDLLRYFDADKHKNLVEQQQAIMEGVRKAAHGDTLQEALRRYMKANHLSPYSMAKIYNSEVRRRGLKLLKGGAVRDFPYISAGYLHKIIHGKDDTPNPSWLRVRLMSEIFELDLDKLALDPEIEAA